MNGDFKIAVKLTLDDSGCLPGLLNHEIERVVKLKRAADSAGDDEHFGRYLGQLRNVLTAVELARAEAVGRHPEAEAMMRSDIIGRDNGVGGCGGRCGKSMESFDQLPRVIRDALNYDVPLKPCTCHALDTAKRFGALPQLAYRQWLEARRDAS